MAAELTGARFWRITANGARVEVKVQPKSRRPGVQGEVPGPTGTRLRIGVGEAAEDGRANKAACAVLTQALGVPAACASIVVGATSRQKTILVLGDPEFLAVRLAAL